MTTQFDKSQTTALSEPASTEGMVPVGPVQECPPENLVDESPPSPEKSVKQRRSFWGLPFLWFILIMGFGVTGSFALMWLLKTPPPPNCQQEAPLVSDGEKLYCLQQAANSGKLDKILQALAFVQSWSAENPLYNQAQQLKEEWSKSLLHLASNKIEQGDLQGALQIVAKIPKDIPFYKGEVEPTIAGWRNNWDEGQKIYDKAIQALKDQNLRKASDYVQALFQLNNVFWGRKRFNELVEQIALEKQGWQRLNEAKALANSGRPDKLGEAIALANQIPKNLYARKEADAEMLNWSRTLIKIATQRLNAKDIGGAIDAANYIPSYSLLYAEAQDLMQLGRAQAVTWNQSITTPIYEHIFNLLEGQAAAGQIVPGRPLYQQAQTQIQNLQTQYPDLLRLQMANAIANIGQPFTFQWAIEQAQMVSPKAPRRIHAQTMVAIWRKEILRLEDQPYLLSARQLAQKQTVVDFQKAISQASLIRPGRPLHIEAQTDIAQWRKQIEIVEDQPLLNDAIAFAQQGNLNAAVDKASKIKRGRSLYQEAQAKTTEWVTQLQIAQDKPILAQANELASKGNFSEAINTAAQIRYGRALYDEAQGAIGRWISEREALSAPPPRRRQASAPEHQYTPPREEYTPPRQEQYTPPREEYTPPRQEEPAPPPREEYTPPRQEAPAPEPPAPAAAPEAPPAASTPSQPAKTPDSNVLPE
jgi:soluble cytochrome b562